MGKWRVSGGRVGRVELRRKRGSKVRGSMGRGRGSSSVASSSVESRSVESSSVGMRQCSPLQLLWSNIAIDEDLAKGVTPRLLGAWGGPLAYRFHRRASLRLSLRCRRRGECGESTGAGSGCVGGEASCLCVTKRYLRFGRACCFGLIASLNTRGLMLLCGGWWQPARPARQRRLQRGGGVRRGNCSAGGGGTRRRRRRQGGSPAGGGVTRRQHRD